jgi:hypothetical protein
MISAPRRSGHCEGTSETRGVVIPFPSQTDWQTDHVKQQIPGPAWQQVPDPPWPQPMTLKDPQPMLRSSTNTGEVLPLRQLPYSPQRDREESQEPQHAPY